jgi:hypothetical protein
MQMSVGLYVVRNRIACKDQLVKLEDDPLRLHREVTEEIYAAAGCLRPLNGKEPETRLLRGKFSSESYRARTSGSTFCGRNLHRKKSPKHLETFSTC